DLVHELVVMRSFAAERDVGQLAGTVAVDQQHLGGQVGAVVAGEPLDQVENQVQERGRPAGGDDVAGIHDHLVGRHVHRRVASAQFAGEHPMGGGRAAVQQAGV